MKSFSEHIQMRLATIADAEDIRALTREAYAKWVPILGREPLPMTADYVAALREHRFDLVEIGGRLAALIETADEGGRLLIINVAVAPAYQGRGLGRRLMAEAEAIAARLRAPTIRLFTNKLFAANIALYQRLGYAIDREEPFMGGATVHMSKQVSAP